MEMTQYRLKSPVVEAYELTEENFADVVTLLGDAVVGSYEFAIIIGTKGPFNSDVQYAAHPGQYIVKLSYGWVVVDKQVFEDNYEVVPNPIE